MTQINHDALNMLIAIGKCHRLLVAVATAHQSRPDVKEVKHVTDIYPTGDGVRLEEFVDVELLTGAIYCWSLECTTGPETTAIEASVLINKDREPQDVVAEIADSEFHNTDDISNALLEITQELCNFRPF